MNEVTRRIQERHATVIKTRLIWCLVNGDNTVHLSNRCTDAIAPNTFSDFADVAKKLLALLVCMRTHGRRATTITPFQQSQNQRKLSNEMTIECVSAPAYTKDWQPRASSTHGPPCVSEEHIFCIHRHGSWLRCSLSGRAVPRKPFFLCLHGPHGTPVTRLLVAQAAGL